MNNITLTMTTCKRLPLFKETFASLQSACTDFDRIDKVVCVDDNSHPQEQEEMRAILEREFGQRNTIFIAKTPQQRGLGWSMNLLWENVKSRYVFHLEDDWLFVNAGSFLTVATNIIEDTDHVKSVVLREMKFLPVKETKNGLPFYEWRSGPDLTGEMREHGYSLNPSVQDVAYLRKYGGFKHTLVEGSFGNEYYADGHRTAGTMTDYVIHIGAVSAFDLNRTPR